MPKVLQGLHRLVRNHTSQAIVLAVLYIIAASIVALLRHYSYHTYALDLGSFAQALQSTLRGEVLYTTTCGMSQLGYHFSPILFLLVPIFWLAPYCETLLIVQSVALGLSGYLVYRLARIQQLSHRTALFIEVLFLFSPLVWGVNFFDFHEVALAIPMLLIMLIGLVQKKWKLFALGFALSLMTKEDVIIALALFGLVMLVAQYIKNRKIDKVFLTILGVSMATYGIATVVARESSGVDVPPMLMYGSLRYPYINEPIGQAISHALRTFFGSSSMLLLLAYFLPLGFLPLFSPLWAAPAIFILVMSMLSSVHWLAQYSAAAIPFLFMALINTLTWMRDERRVKFVMKRCWRFLPIVMIIAALAINSLPSSTLRHIAAIPASPAKTIDSVIALIPDNATVTAPNHIFPHLCLRTTAYLPPWTDESSPNRLYGDFGVPDRETDYVVIDSKYKWSGRGGGWWEEEIIDYLQDKYELVVQVESVYLYKLRHSD